MGIEEVSDKLAWTRHHFDILDNVVTTYIHPNNVTFLADRYNETKTEVWGQFESKLGSHTAIPHIFGDVLQSANSTLDYLVCELFRRHNPGEEAKPSHQFPIVTNHGAFNEEIGRNRFFGIPFEAVAVIEGLQPYDGRTDPVHSHLQALRNLTNTHKHRKVHVSTLTANPAPSDPSLIIEKDGELLARTGDLPAAMHFKAKVGPLPCINGHVDMKGKYAPVVVLEERGFREVIITLWAERFCQAVSEACRRLEPFFK